MSSKYSREASYAARTWRPDDRSDGRELKTLTQFARLPYVSSSHSLTVGVPPRREVKAMRAMPPPPPPSWVESFKPPIKVLTEAQKEALRQKRWNTVDRFSMSAMKANQKRKRGMK